MRTPWGKSDSKKSYGSGITFYGTPPHGGFKLDKKRNALVPEALRLKDGWYEEDCEYHRVVIAFPALFTPDEVNAAHKSVKNWSPDAYAAFSGRPVLVEESRVLRERAFKIAHVNDFIAVCAFGDWHEKVPAGMVGVLAVKGGDRMAEGSYFLVPGGEYEVNPNAGFGFVINPTKHTAWVDHA